MKNQNYLNDLKDIKELMSRSTQFVSLSGLSGILAGLYALIGAAVAKTMIDAERQEYITLESTTFRNLIILAFLVLVCSVGTAYFLTVKKAKKANEHIWNATSKRLIINFCIPLVTGGIFSMLLLKNGYYGLIAPITLIFYGMSCLNASKYTLRDVRYLGITQIILGLIAVEYSGYGLYFWVIGFGICHIVYGSVMYYKYDR